MKGSFLFIRHGDPDTRERLAVRAASSTGLGIHSRHRTGTLLIGSGTSVISAGNHGVVIGTIFPKNGPPKALRELDLNLDTTPSLQFVPEIFERYFGGYCLLDDGGEDPAIVRDPSGALNCLVYRGHGVTAIASHADHIFASLGIAPEISWIDVARHLWCEGLPRAETALINIVEVLPGTSLSVGGDGTAVEHWNPQAFAARRSGVSRIELVENLRRSVENSISAWASEFDSVVLGVSGGLDSSIVAACLSRSGTKLTCLTMATTDPDGDERLFALALCERFGLQLIELFYDFDDVDLGRSSVPHLARPIGRSIALPFDEACLRVARNNAASAFFTGNGGDNVFAYSNSAAAIFDRLIAQGPGIGVARTIGDVCKLTGCSVLQAIAACRRQWRVRREGYAWHYESGYLRDDIVAQFQADSSHDSWLRASSSVLPGKLEHIAALMRFQQLLPGTGRGLTAPIINPLMSQPIVELCLGIPSWEWCSGGKNRSVAREAFASVLPPIVSRRTTKGGPDAFGVAIIERRKSEIRDRLLNGRLVAEGLVDPAKLECALRNQGPHLGVDQIRLLSLVDVEAWISRWSAFRS